jgi:hypothetical protein
MRINIFPKKFSLSRGGNHQRGVAVIFFVIVFGLLLGFLMMVGNTGLLVYQKMRLQSAVDLAAYAGASVKAAYLGNDRSGEDSIHAINMKILERYGELLNELQFGYVAPWPVAMPNAVSCLAACQAGNLANGAHAANLYKKAAEDIEVYRQRVANILSQLPEASRKAAEETLRLNIPELAVSGGGILESIGGNTTNQVSAVLAANKTQGSDGLGSGQKKNAMLSFTSEKGMYLANVVAPVPHSFVYYGPACFNATYLQEAAPAWFCMVNGAGMHGPNGFNAAALAFARAKAPAIASGNVGNLSSIADQSANAIRLMFIPNPHRPEPSITVAAEWYPAQARYATFENTLGANGSLFPEPSKLVAVATAEPFGGNLASSQPTTFGVRLQSIRKVLLDPRMLLVQDDYPSMYEYFESLAPVDSSGRAVESSVEVIRRFRH